MTVDKNVVEIDLPIGMNAEVMIVVDTMTQGVIVEKKEIEDIAGDLVEMTDRIVAVPEVQKEILSDDVMIVTDRFKTKYLLLCREKEM